MSTLKYQGTLEFPAWNFQAISGGFPLVMLYFNTSLGIFKPFGRQHPL
jgi:hypothetical protein